MSSLARLFAAALFCLAAPVVRAADPPTLLNGSFFGGNGAFDDIVDVALSAQNEVFIAGYTTSSNLPVSPGSLPFGNSGNLGKDGFVCKFAADARTLIWCAYVGSAASDYITGLAIDAQGNAYVSGYQLIASEINNSANAFIAKISWNGSQISWQGDMFGVCELTCVDYRDDRATDIAITPDGSQVVVVGITTSPELFTLNAGQPTLTGGQDGFIRRYSTADLTLLSSSFIGTVHEDTISAVTIGADNRIYYTGKIRNPGMPGDTVQEVWAGKLNPNATASAWSGVPFAGKTFGGALADGALDLRLTANGNALAVVGWTMSSDFHDNALPGLDKIHVAGEEDAFLMLLNANTGAPTYFTYLGSDDKIQRARAVMPMPNGDVAVLGDTVNNPTTCGLQPCEGDAFLLRLNMSPLNATSPDYPAWYFGGSGVERGSAIAIGAGGLMHLVGLATNGDFQEITPNAYQPTMASGGFGEGFMLRLYDAQDFGGFVSFSSATANVGEGAGSITLTVTRTGLLAGAEVKYATANGTAQAGSDYLGVNGTLTFAENETSKTIEVLISNDSTPESAETFTVTLSNATGGAILRAPTTVTVTIQDNDTPTHTVTASNQSPICNRQPLQLSASTVAGASYAWTGPNGFTSTAQNPIIHNTTMAAAGTYSVVATVNGVPSAPSTTTAVLNACQISINSPPPVTEGTGGSTTVIFQVTTSHASKVPISMQWQTVNGTATAPADYGAGNGTVTIQADATGTSISRPIVTDALDEENETFHIDLSNVSGGTLATARGTATILDDDDPAPSVTASSQSPICNRQTLQLSASTIAGASYAWSGPNGFTSTAQNPSIANAGTAASGSYSVVATVNGNPSAPATTIATVNACQIGIANPPPIAEGTGGSTTVIFQVTTSHASKVPISMQWQTVNGTAIAPADYAAGAGPVTIAANATATQITRPIVTDALDEDNETFHIDLSNLSGGTLATARGTATITDDDDAPGLSVEHGGCSVTEGNSGSVSCDFVLKLSTASGKTVSFTTATANGTATAGSDYTTRPATPGSIAAGQTSLTVPVSVLGDTVDEPNETFRLNVTNIVNAVGVDLPGIGTIVDDDGAPSLSINDVSLIEGDSGNRPMQFTVSLQPASGQTVTVSWATANGTAMAGSDYVAASGTLTFTPGQTSKPVVVQVIGDTVDEGDETLHVNLSGAQNAGIGDAQGIGTILDEDEPSEGDVFEDGFE